MAVNQEYKEYRVNDLPETGYAGDRYYLNVGGGKFQTYIISDALTPVRESGQEFIECDTVDDLRNLDSRQILAIQNGYYKGVTLNGYYKENDTPASIQYYLSDTEKEDDGYSVFSISNIKLEHKFKDIIHHSYAGIKGDGSDETILVQRVLDSLDYGQTLDIYDVSILVSKNENLEGYPNNDQPCLVLRDKTAVTINANKASFRTLNHAQGILEIVRCSVCVVRGIHVIGAGNFPQIDGITGRGEKGTTSAGYGTSGFWGYNKNNSNDTSGDNRGGYNGQFPQWDGGTASTWGVWNGGFIGNVSYGILINEGCYNCIIENCEAEGFNYVGIGVGHNGNFLPTNLNYDFNKGIIIRGCNCHDNYSAGVHSTHVDGFILVDTDLTRNGHPDADIDIHEFHDPGYGYTARTTNDNYTRNALVEKNRAVDNKRKGLDIHAGDNITFRKNYVSGSYVCGIFAAWSSPLQRCEGTLIEDNTIESCAFGSGALGAIYIGSDPTSDNWNIACKVLNNNINNYGASGIRARYAENAIIQGNQLRNGARIGRTPTLADIIIQGQNITKNSRNISVRDNTIIDNENSNINRGIQASFTDISNISDNVVDKSKTDVNIGIYASNCNYVDFKENKVLLGDIGTPYVLGQTKGFVKDNLENGGNQLSYMFKNQDNKGVAQSQIIVSFSITFNGTNEPVLTKIGSTDLIGDLSMSSVQLFVSLNIKNAAAVNIIPIITSPSSNGIRTNTEVLSNIKCIESSNTQATFEFKSQENLASPRVNPATIQSGTIYVTLILI